MPEFKDLPDDFSCPYRDGCPYLEGLSTGWVFYQYQHTEPTECHYEHQLEEINQQWRQEQRRCQELQAENQQLRAQLQALHRRQFKGRRTSAQSSTNCPSLRRKKRGAPVGHPPWQRRRPEHIDQVVEVPAPRSCPDCHSKNLKPLPEIHEHLQEDIVLQPRTVVTCFRHGLAYCPQCDKDVWLDRKSVV